MSEWKTFQIGEISNLIQGLAINAQSKHLILNEAKGLPLLRIKDLLEDTQEIFIDEENVPSSCIADENDLIFTRTGQVGFVFVGKKGVVHNNCFKIVPKDNRLHLPFLYYYLNRENVRDYLENISAGSVQSDMTHSIFKTVEVPLPPLPEQKAIVSVLSSLDDKIDLLHRQNKTLEAMAETLFRQWFVEEAQEDWEEVTLGECCRVITKGTTPTTLKKKFVSSGINFIKVNCIDENGNFLPEKFQFIDEETNNLLDRSKLEEGDILYSIAGTIGRLIIVTKEILPANVNQALAIIRVNSEKINPVFIKYCLKDREITGTLLSKVVHAVQPNLSLGEISKTIVAFPYKELLNDFVEIVEPIEIKMQRNKSQIRTLEKLRDTLLPKLMSGEVRVKI